MDEIKFKEAIASLMTNQNNRQALAEMFVEYIKPNEITVDFIGMLLNSRSLKPGDSLVKKMRKGVQVHTLVPGAIHLAHEITVTERINYVLDGLNVKVTANEWELNSGEIGTVADIRKEMLVQLKNTFYNRIFTALTTIWTAINTPTNFTSVGGPITSNALEDAIDNINNTTSGVKAVVGVRSAMTPISKFGAFWDDGGSTIVGVDSQLEEVMKRGRLGTYYGAPLIVLDQIWDNPESYNALLPTDKILVIGEDVGEFITYGDTQYKQYIDPRPTPSQWVFENYLQFGLMIWRAQGIHVLGNLS